MMEVQIDGKLEELNDKMVDNTDPRQRFHILSIISWILLIISMWPFYKDHYYIWSKIECQIIKFLKAEEIYYFPIQMNTEWISIFIFLITVVGFIVFLIFTTCLRNNNLFNGIFSKAGMFHFIPLLFISAIFFITRNFDKMEDIDVFYEVNNNNYYRDIYRLKDSVRDKFKYNRTLLIFDLIFTIIGLITLICFYCRMELKCPWYFIMTLKKGAFSTYIVLLWYNIFHIIISLRSLFVFIDIGGDDGLDKNDIVNFYEKIGIAFSIVIGLIIIFFSIYFKDIMISFVNFLMYSGLVMAYYNKNEVEKDEIKEDFNDGVDGIVDIVIMCVSLFIKENNYYS